MPKKRILSLLLAAVLLCSLGVLALPARADVDPGTYVVSVTRTVNGTVLHDLKGLAAGTELTVSVSLTRTDAEGAAYHCRGLELDINDYGLEYIEDSAVSFGYSVSGSAQTATVGGYQIGGATGIGNLRFFFIFGSQSAYANTTLVDKTVTVSARYRVTDPAAARAWAPTSIIYVGAEKATDITVNEYLVTFDPNGGVMETDPSGAYSLGDTVAMPTPVRPGSSFLGWYDGSASYTGSWTVDGDKHFTARWQRQAHTVVGVVVEEDGTPIPGVIVTLVKGLEEFGSTVTDANGRFSLVAADDDYNLVAYDPVLDRTKTELVSVRENAPEMTVVMPGGDKNSILDNTNSGEFAARVGGLDDIAEQENPGPGERIIIRLTVTADERKSTLGAADEAEYEEGKAAILALPILADQTVVFLDLSLERTAIGGTSPGVTDIGDTNTQLLRIILPFNTSGKTNIRVFRYHKYSGVGVAEQLTATPNAQGEYIIVGTNQIEVFAKLFSAYAISYSTPGGGGGGGTAAKYPVTVKKSDHGAVSSDKAEAAKDETVILTPAPEESYELSSISAVDKDGNSLALTKQDDGSYSFTMPASPVTVSASFLKKLVSPTVSGVADWLITDEHIVYINGYPDGSVKSGNNITRAETAMIFYRLLKNPNVTITVGFPDVADGAWYAVAVNTLASIGIINGYPDGTFGPGKQITRAEFAAIATRFAIATGGAASFTDVPVTHWAQGNIATASDYGWVNGYPDGSFGPGKPITRAEVATVVNHMLGRAADEAYVLANPGKLKVFSDLQEPSKWYYLDMVEATNEHDFTAADGKEVWR